RDTALTGATMTSADLRGATFERTSLRGLDLSTVLGLSSGQVAELTTLPLTVPVTPSAPPTLAEEKVPAPKAVATSTMTRERAGPVAKATQKPVKTVKAKIATAGGNGGAKVGYRVQFGSFRNEAIANASSNRFAARHQNAFKGVGIGLERTDYGAPRGTWHRLVSGRLSTKAKAKALCESLKREDSSVHCIVVR
ncbi:MAG: cell division septation protein DedD, partial [Gammaproteobacteria bacterium]